jgi:hypothetical protein
MASCSLRQCRHASCCRTAGSALLDDGSKYSGDFVAGVREGQGSCTLASGDKYRGCWQGDKRHGQGSCSYANGDRCVRCWLLGSRASRALADSGMASRCQSHCPAAGIGASGHRASATGTAPACLLMACASPAAGRTTSGCNLLLTLGVAGQQAKGCAARWQAMWRSSPLR